MPMRDNGYRAVGEAAAIFALALSTRWLYVHQTSDHPLRDIPIGATIAHVERAAGAAAGFASLYDAFLGGVLGMAGGDFQLVRGVQVALGAVNCLLVWSLARAVFSPGVAVAAGLAAALYGPAIYFAGELLPPVLATCLVLLSLIALSRVLTATGTSLFCLSGLLLGLAVLAEWWVSLFALVILVWLLHRKNRGAAGWLALGISALLPAIMWSAWTPEFAELGLAEGFRRVYALWQGIEFLPDLDPYYARQHSSLLSALLWKAGLAFPFGLVAPLALVGILSRLRVERQPMETALLLFAGCFTVQALLFSPADSTVRSPAAPALLIFAAVGVAAMSALPRRPALAVGAAGLLLAVGLNTGDVRAASRARQHYWLGYGFEQLGLRANAVREYELALALDAGSIETYYALAKHYLAQGDNIRAGGLYERLLQQWPDQDRARRALGEVYMASGRAPEAAKLYRALIDAEADSAAALLPMLGEALVRSGDMEGGIRAYREALDVLPSNGEARGKLALLYSATGQLAEAEDAYRILFEAGQVAEFGPPLAEVLIRSQRDEDAAAVLERVLQVAPESTAALALRGKQLFGQGRYRAAATYFERLRQLWPQDYRVYFFLAKLYEHLGEETKADDAHALYTRYRRHQEREEMQEHMQLVGEMMAENLKSHLEQR